MASLGRHTWEVLIAFRGYGMLKELLAQLICTRRAVGISEEYLCKIRISKYVSHSTFSGETTYQSVNCV